MEQIEGKVIAKLKRKVTRTKRLDSVFLISQNSTHTHTHRAWQAAGGADGARSEGSRRPAASVNQCHALEPHLSEEPCC